MKRVNKKLIISIIALIYISACAFTFLTFSLADENEGIRVADSVVFASSTDATMNQMDRIIDNSHNGGYGKTDDKYYHILEVSSGAASKLEYLVKGDTTTASKFRTLIIDSYAKNQEIKMVPEMFEYSFVQVKEDNSTDDEIVAKIAAADFIYITNDPNNMYSEKLDFSEAVKDAIVNAATVDFKPVMIDSYSLTYNSGIKDDKTIAELISKEFYNISTAYRQPTDADTYLMNNSGSDYHFNPIHGDYQKSVWVNSNAKVLAIGTDDGTDYKISEMLGFNSTVLGSETSVDDVASDMLLSRGYYKREAKPKKFNYTRVGISGLIDFYKNLPDDAGIDTYDYIILEKGITTSLSDEQYSCLAGLAQSGVHLLYANYDTSANQYHSKNDNPATGYAYVLDKLATADDVSRYGNVLVTSQNKVQTYSQTKVKLGVKDIADIILNGSFRGIYGSDSGGDSSTVYTILEIEPCYPIDLELAKAYGNSGIFGNDTSGNGSVVDVLASTYADNDKKKLYHTTGFYREPFNNSDYGMYYIRNSAVKNNTTADEISFGDDTPLSGYVSDSNSTRVQKLTDKINALKTNDNDKICDYYNWTLSKAKIAHALKLSYNEVNVVHMSTEEFNTSTKTLLDNYDAIFIGGDNSSIKATWYNNNQYTMYFRYGDSYPVGTEQWQNMFAGTNLSGKLTGNDISNKKLDELNSYAEKMPVIVSKQLTDSFSSSNTQVDPTSNMHAFLDSIKTKTNVLWGFDTSKTIKVTNFQQQYGKTVGEYATVFAGRDMYAYDAQDDTDINQYYNQTGVTGKKDVIDLSEALKTQRPRLLVKKRPVEYVVGDKSTDITLNDVNWTFETGLTNYRVNLYIDENRNSRFELTKDLSDPDNDPINNPDDFISDDANLNKTELKYSADNITEITFDKLTKSKAIKSTYCGPIYWKLEIVKLDGTGDTATESSIKASVTGLCKIAYAEKKKVHLLQIMPHVNRADNSEDTLYLCTECQHSRKILHGNYNAGSTSKYGPGCVSVGTADSYIDQDAKATSNYIDNANAKVVGKQIDKYDDTDTIDTSWSYSANSTNLGIHQHRFGIVKYFDDYTYYDDYKKKDIHSESGADYVGLDDWSTNWFDDVSDDYEVEVDVMYHDEFENLCKEVNSVYQSLNGASAVEDIKARKQTYEDASDLNYKYYNVMINIINGKYNVNDIKIKNNDDGSHVYDTGDDDLNDFLLVLEKEIKIGASNYNASTGAITYTTTPTPDNVKMLISAFSKSGDLCSDYILNNLENIIAYSKTDDKIPGTEEYLRKDLNHIADKSIVPDKRELYDYFSEWKDSAKGLAYIDDYACRFVAWRDAKALEQYFYQKYLLYAEYSSVFESNSAKSPDRIGTFDLSNIWTCVALGAAENFGHKDLNELACYTLLNYCNNSGNLLLFHDTLTAEVSGPYDGSTVGTPNMTKILSNAFGMSGTSKVDIRFDNNTQQITKCETQYISDPIGAATTGKTYTIRDVNFKMDASTKPETIGKNKFVVYDYQGETNNQTLHAKHSTRRAIAQVEGQAASDKAEQTNEGVITQYPFKIANRLQISPTSGSGYPANVNDPKMVVYYTIEGGSAGSLSTNFAADPHDGINNYFLYQYGKVTYTGAGHSIITGIHRANNDERKLFINVILNTATGGSGAMKPTLTLHDHSSTTDKLPDSLTNNEVIECVEQDNENGTETDKDDYVYYVSSKKAVPEFSIYPVCIDDQITKLQVFYDRPNDATDAFNAKNVFDGNDVEIYSHKEDTVENVSSGLLKKIDPDTGVNVKIGKNAQDVTLLALQPEYFVGKDGNAAYIVVYMETASGGKQTKNIRIELAPELFDLN
ncbi:hypothetical protein SAMN02910369_01339 [Lachnospiraceae bacterium NE2001]|nr:hypothetical protein SAMN02910369_01339 [Lachnospiraceae bacterium NE2001]